MWSVVPRPGSGTERPHQRGGLEFAQQRLTQLGVDAALRRAGVQFGDTVHIGDFSFDYEEDE